MSKLSRLLGLLTAGACLWIAAAGAPSAEPTATESPLAKALWIAPPASADRHSPLPLLRKEFSVSAKPVRAILRIVGLGDYDPRINGKRLAGTGINQPWSQYEKTIYYREFDITSLVHPGANCVGVMLGNSFWHNPNPPAGRYNKPGPQRKAKEPLLLCARDHLGAQRRLRQPHRHRRELADRAGAGRVLARLRRRGFRRPPQQPGWASPGLDDHGWQPARVVPAPTARLVRQDWPPIPDYARFCTGVGQGAGGRAFFSTASRRIARPRLRYN